MGLANLTLWVLLLLPLVVAPLLGLLTPYAALLVIVPLFFVTLFQRNVLPAYQSYEARAFLVVFVVLAVLFALTADSVSDALRAFNFTMLLAYGTTAYFLAQRAGTISAERVAQLAGLGVAIGFLEVLVSALLGAERASGPNIGPIVLSNALLVLGFISLGGALLRRGRLAWLYLLPPLLAIIATFITTSRGPLLAVPVAILVAAWIFWRKRFGGSVRTAIAGLGALVALSILGVAVFLQSRAGSLLEIVRTIAQGGTVADESTRQRLVFYSVGWQSFLQSPWVGHGWANIMDSVRPFFPARDAALATFPQLHNDVVNFAVGAGVVGVLCYLAIISAPLLGAWLGPKDSQRTFRLYGAAMLTIVYVGGGLTDLMFGFEFHTFLFVMLTAILLGFCRDKVPA